MSGRRRAASWKFVFYELMLPALRRLGPAPADAALAILGRLAAILIPRRKTRLIGALRRAREALELVEPVERRWAELAANSARFLARDYLLDVPSDGATLERFEVAGEGELRQAIAAGRGAILVGAHHAAHIAGLHWLFRSGLRVRALVQRPPHISQTLAKLFDTADSPIAQADLFLKRELTAAQSVERLVSARCVLRHGMALYLNGDIPWTGCNTRPGQLLGRNDEFLALWPDLAVLTGAPVFYVFCTHLPRGRYRLELEVVGTIALGTEQAAVQRFFRSLEARIGADPTQAVAHLLWPCYAGPDPRKRRSQPSRDLADPQRPSRRNSEAARRSQRSRGPTSPRPETPSSSTGAPASSRSSAAS